jgi:hypothetical protein
LPYLGAAIVIIALMAAGVSRTLRQRLPLRRLWLSLFSLGLSAGLMTNLILKSHSGRPRPRQTDLFGGSLEFMPAGSFNGACERNCSFVSGEASGAGWLNLSSFLTSAPLSYLDSASRHSSFHNYGCSPGGGGGSLRIRCNTWMAPLDQRLRRHACARRAGLRSLTSHPFSD